MKHKLFLILSSLFLLLSCSEDGPIGIGRFVSDIKVTLNTPNAIVMNVTLPRDKDNLLLGGSHTEFYLSPNPITQVLDRWSDDIIEGSIQECESGNFVVCFGDLKPNTRYYMAIYTDMPDFGNEWFAPDFSFTTAKEGDYSDLDLGKATCEVLESDYGFVQVQVTLPEGLRVKDDYKWRESFCLEASISQDMTEAQKSIAYYCLNENKINFAFNNLQSGEYYFRLSGAFALSNGIPLGDCIMSIDLSNTIEIKDNENLNIPPCELVFAGVNFTILRFVLPSIFFNDDVEIYGIKWSSSKNDNIDNLYYNQYFFEGEYLYINIPRGLEKDEEICFSFDCRISYYDYYYDYHYDNYTVIETKYSIKDEKPLIPNPTLENIFDGKDYSVVKIIIPQSNDIDWWNMWELRVSENINFADYDVLDVLHGGSSFSEAMLVKACPSIYADQYLQIAGDLNIFNFNINDGIINVDGCIPHPKDARNLLEITSLKENGNLILTFSCPDEFKFDKSNWSILSCKDIGSDDFIFENYFADNSLSNEKDIVFILNRDKVAKLRKGTKYTLLIEHFDLYYVGPQGPQLLIDEVYNNTIEYEWTYQ